jgi:hypothetical protein
MRGVEGIVLVAAVGLTAVVFGVAPGGVEPTAADCGMQFPDTWSAAGRAEGERCPSVMVEPPSARPTVQR